ncbi:MAG: alpha/beta hydrolase [Lachnospiraceae bacterium]|nr:alpha/beta hydrolase [Lachnospiraceae bacterium]
MIIKENIYYSPAGQDRTLHVYLPDNYDSSEERYPVMYFFDGHNLFCDEDATYGKSWGLKTFLDGWSKHMIVVGIECSHEGFRRLDEYSPYNGRLMGYDIHGTGKETMDWITGTLKPYVDSQLRTYPFRTATGIAGSSMGGLMSLYAVTMYNHIFSKAACVSSAIGFTRRAVMADLQRASLDPDTRVFLSWGEREDFRNYASRDNHEVQNLLREKNVSTQLLRQQGGGHNEADWEKLVPGFMEYLWMS